MFIVETRMVNHWENCWTEMTKDEGDKPMTFPTRSDAEEAIHDLLVEMPDYHPADYRIVEVQQ
jgi:hypothetical protein